jgi:hypothetical protein
MFLVGDELQQRRRIPTTARNCEEEANATQTIARTFLAPHQRTAIPKGLTSIAPGETGGDKKNLQWRATGKTGSGFTLSGPQRHPASGR